MKFRKVSSDFLAYLGVIYLFLFILMILMREGDTPEGASPKGLGWPLHREKKKNLNESRKSKPNSENWTTLESSYEA